MTLRNLLILNAVIALPFGLGFVLIPGVMWTLYGMGNTPATNLAGQLFGVELIAVGVLCWLVRDATETRAMPGITLALLIADMIGLIVTSVGTFTGVMNAFGWSGIVIYSGLAIGYAYFMFRKPVAAST